MNAVIALIEALLPNLGGNVSLIGKIITAITSLIPIIVQEYKDLVPIVKNIITALKADPSTLPAQLDALDEAEKQLDADYDDAFARAQAEDAAADAAKS